ncbi:hypothetical protein WJX79_009660 [Trebouxia sp. C0005]
MSKRERDFTATLEPQLKQHVRGDNKVDSFAAMLAASKAQAKKGFTTGPATSESANTTACNHCGGHEAGLDRMRQCAGGKWIRAAILDHAKKQSV